MSFQQMVLKRGMKTCYVCSVSFYSDWKNAKYCSPKCKIKNNYKKKLYATKEDMVLYLLKSQKANMGMLCAFCKTTKDQTIRQLITALRKKGYKIKSTGKNGYYYLK
jgi:hypothetical protein